MNIEYHIPSSSLVLSPFTDEWFKLGRTSESVDFFPNYIRHTFLAAKYQVFNTLQLSVALYAQPIAKDFTSYEAAFFNTMHDLIARVCLKTGVHASTIHGTAVFVQESHMFHTQIACGMQELYIKHSPYEVVKYLAIPVQPSSTRPTASCPFFETANPASTIDKMLPPKVTYKYACGNGNYICVPAEFIELWVFVHGVLVYRTNVEQVVYDLKHRHVMATKGYIGVAPQTEHDNPDHFLLDGSPKEHPYAGVYRNGAVTPRI